MSCSVCHIIPIHYVEIDFAIKITREEDEKIIPQQHIVKVCKDCYDKYIDKKIIKEIKDMINSFSRLSDKEKRQAYCNIVNMINNDLLYKARLSYQRWCIIL